ncbi:MAG: sensor histidine kinase [Deferribacterales bacterium]
MKNIILKIIPSSLGKRTALLISGLAFATIIINLAVIFYFEYASSFRNAEKYINAQFTIMSDDLSEAIITDDIYALFTTIESVSQSIPNIDNIAVYNADGEYISDAMVRVDKLTSTDNTIIISKDIRAGARRIGTIDFFINRDLIIRQIAVNVTKLFVVSFILILIGTIAGLYLVSKMTAPLVDLSAQIKNLDVLELPYKFSISEFSSSETQNLKNVIENLSLKLKNAIDTINDQQKEISRSERLAYIGTMSAGLAHELKNPIMTINLIIENLAEETAGNPQIKEDFIIIKQETSKLVFRINEFLEYSRPVKLFFSQTSTFELIDFIRKNVIAEKTVRLKVSYKSQEDWILITDMTKIAQIAEIFISNSAAAGADSVEFEFSVKDGRFTIVCDDNGTGLKADVSKMLLPFYTTKKDGSGLGLAICATITDAMGGDIKAENNISGGARFTISLPIPDSV